MLLPLGNLTGIWSLQDDDWDSSTRLELTTYDIGDGLARFRILCMDGGVAYHCSADHPGHNGTNWHEGEGVVDLTASPPLRCNPKAKPAETCPDGANCPSTGVCPGKTVRHVTASFDNLFHNNGTVGVNYTHISWNSSGSGDGTTQVRFPVTFPVTFPATFLTFPLTLRRRSGTAYRPTASPQRCHCL
jgi:hypothetical protein